MKVVKAWLPLAFALSMLAGLLYVSGQYILRHSANDPQIQLSQDWTAQIQVGTLPKQLDLGVPIDPGKSLAPFGIMYNAEGKIVASSVKTPESMALPDGVLESVDRSSNAESRFTWQPASGERYAVVIKKSQGADGAVYYALAGRNLREVEKRESQLFAMTVFAWLVTLAGSFYIQYVIRKSV